MALVQPAEWMPHAAVWSAWPSHGDLWAENLDGARCEVAALFAAIADIDTGSGTARGEHLHIAVDGAEARSSAEGMLAELIRVRTLTLHDLPFGDIWFRDTAPIFVGENAAGRLVASCFRFNGWGGKYDLPGDSTVSTRVAALSGLSAFQRDWVLEGGSVEVDGRGLLLTTRQCLLNPNRNPQLDQGDVEQRLAADLGARQVVWLGDGLVNDHTDGHIDNLARIIGPGRVLLPEADSGDDPNAHVFADAAALLRAAGVQLQRAPSVGFLPNEDGEALPASYMNFYISNTRVVVPVYGAANDDAAVAAIGALFPGREAVGLRANHILTGGGSFHCITQQVPHWPLKGQE